MISFGDDMGGMGAPEGEDLVAGPVEVEKGLREDLVLPLQDGIKSPVDEAVVAFPDDVAHEAAVMGPRHGQAVFGDRGYFEEGGGDQQA